MLPPHLQHIERTSFFVVCLDYYFLQSFHWICMSNIKSLKSRSLSNCSMKKKILGWFPIHQTVFHWLILILMVMRPKFQPTKHIFKGFIWTGINSVWQITLLFPIFLYKHCWFAFLLKHPVIHKMKVFKTHHPQNQIQCKMKQPDLWEQQAEEKLQRLILYIPATKNQIPDYHYGLATTFVVHFVEALHQV